MIYLVAASLLLGIALIGLLGCAAPLLGHKALIWLVNAGSFGALDR